MRMMGVPAPEQPYRFKLTSGKTTSTMWRCNRDKKLRWIFYFIIQLCLPVCRRTSVRNSYTSFVIPVPSNHSLHKNLPLKFGCQYNRKMLLTSKEVCLRELRHFTVSCPCWPNGDSLLNGPFSNKYNTIISLMYLGQQRSGAAYLLAKRETADKELNRR